MRVIAAYWNSWGSPLCTVVSVSLFLMQASKNFSDLWLAFWSRNRDATNGTVPMDTTSMNISTYGDHLKQAVVCIFNNVQYLQYDKCISNSSDASEQITTDSFYLVIYAATAIVNSLLTLIRAISFAYAGLKAAKFMHNRLLKSVFSVKFICVKINTVRQTNRSFHGISFILYL